MTKLNTFMTALALLLGGTAVMAAPLQPASGKAPFFNEVASGSTVSRSVVAAQAAEHMPAAGEMTAWSATRGSMRDRATVAAEAAQWTPASGKFSVTQPIATPVQVHTGTGSNTAPQVWNRLPAAGEQPLDLDQASLPSNTTRQAVIASMAGTMPAAGQMNAGDLEMGLADDSGLSRAEVRAEALQDLPAAGES